MTVQPSPVQPHPYPQAAPVAAVPALPYAPLAPAVAAAPVQVTVSPKSIGVAYVLWLFFGGLGVHQFYLGKTGRAVSMMLTLGWLTVGLWIDLFTLPRQVRAVNASMGITDPRLSR